MDTRSEPVLLREVVPFLFCWFSARNVRPWSASVDIRQSNDFQAILFIVVLESAILLPIVIIISSYFGRSVLEILTILQVLSLIILNYQMLITRRIGLSYRNRFAHMSKKRRAKLKFLSISLVMICLGTPIIFAAIKHASL